MNLCIYALVYSQRSTFELQIRISNAGGVKYAVWALPVGRDESTFWNHETLEATVSSDPLQDVDVVYKDTAEGEETCKQNRYGIMPGDKAGGGYPATHVTGMSICRSPVLLLYYLDSAVSTYILSSGQIMQDHAGSITQVF